METTVVRVRGTLQVDGRTVRGLADVRVPVWCGQAVRWAGALWANSWRRRWKWRRRRWRFHIVAVCVVRRARRASTMTSVSVSRESHKLHLIKTKLTLARAKLRAPPHPAAITV